MLQPAYSMLSPSPLHARDVYYRTVMESRTAHHCLLCGWPPSKGASRAGRSLLTYDNAAREKTGTLETP